MFKSHDVGLCTFRSITFKSCFVCLNFQQMVVCFRLCICEQVTAAARVEQHLLQFFLRLKQVLHAAWHVTHSYTTAASFTLLTQLIHVGILSFLCAVHRYILVIGLWCVLQRKKRLGWTEREKKWIPQLLFLLCRLLHPPILESS